MAFIIKNLSLSDHMPKWSDLTFGVYPVEQWCT